MYVLAYYILMIVVAVSVQLNGTHTFHIGIERIYTIIMATIYTESSKLCMFFNKQNKNFCCFFGYKVVGYKKKKVKTVE